MSRADPTTGQSGRKSGHRVNIDWTKIDGLGVDPDLVIAKRLGLSESAVGQARRRLGRPAPAMWRLTQRVDDIAHLFGTMPDRTVAALTGRSVGAIYEARVHRGIPPWRPYSFDRPTPLGRRWWRRYLWPHRTFRELPPGARW